MPFVADDAAAPAPAASADDAANPATASPPAVFDAPAAAEYALVTFAGRSSVRAAAAGCSPSDDDLKERAALHALLLQYLQHACFLDTADALRAAACRTGDRGPAGSCAVLSDDTADKARKSLVALVHIGRIDDCLLKLSAVFPGALVAPDALALRARFMLHTQLFIELLRSPTTQNHQRALALAQNDFTQYAAAVSLRADLFDILALLAYNSFSACPPALARYIHTDRRADAADALNSLLLRLQTGVDSGTALERIVKQATVVREVLSDFGAAGSAKNESGGGAKRVTLSSSAASTKAAKTFGRWELGLFVQESFA
ncbi:hypothetical protein HDU84_009299 [Entophlyctis sp. JEL0112]|nr:hypothetical protein HDU84_009299 [Entophlyctis sp. JEL0112]